MKTLNLLFLSLFLLISGSVIASKAWQSSNNIKNFSGLSREQKELSFDDKTVTSHSEPRFLRRGNPENYKKTGSPQQQKTLLRDDDFSSFEFVLFHNQHCGYCQKFIPVLKQYAQLHKIPIRAFATDDLKLQNVLKQFFSKNTDIAVPTLFVVTAKDLAYPVSRGYLNYQELDLRIQELLPRITRYENRKS